jgi:PhoPQ-activated pathogenicity-related protein
MTRVFSRLIIILVFLISIPSFAQETALDRYIAKPDDSYAWDHKYVVPGEDSTTHLIWLTSQTWRSEEEVDRPVWTHWLSIVIPKNVDHETAFLYIGGDDNTDPAPENASERNIKLAVETKSIVAELLYVPNQPLFFADSKKEPRSEDDLIAYSRVKYIITGDEEWLARLPMVKSAVKAMDAVQEFVMTERAGMQIVDSFVVAGGSKRAWVTWLTGVVDERVEAIIPLVIDALNTEAVTAHHYAAYGFFSPSLGDYVRHDLYPDKLFTPEFDRILAIEDPYMYRHRARLKIPKYIINASGDQFFLPDNSRFYYNDMPDEKYLRYVENSKHNLRGSDARESMTAFYESILNNTPRPKFDWTIERNGPTTVTVTDKPKAVHIWQAHNPEARDFRVDTIDKTWTKSTLLPNDNGEYVAELPKPDEGFSAFFVELEYDSGGKYPFKFTTDVSIVPDDLPFNLDDHPELVKRRKQQEEN